MAVQAQYPSNILLLNRDIPEGKNTIANDFSLQPPQHGGVGIGGGGELFDQTHMLFNHGVGTSNSRKRTREMISTTTTMNCNPLMSMALHPTQQPQIVDLIQLHTPQNNNNVVSTGLGLAFGDQQQHHNHHNHNHSHQQHQYSLSSQSSAESSVLMSMLSDDLASNVKQQREEIDNFIRLQGEQLRRTLMEKRQRHYRALLVAAEEAVARRLREKEMEVEKAIRRNVDLEARAAQMRAEAQAWQARARVQEATAATLQAQLQQAIMRNSGGGGVGCSGQDMDEWGNVVEGGGGVVVAEDAESAYIDPDRVSELTGPSCKACGRRVASMVVLPCRHLCLCTGCDSVAQACPLCFTFRSSSIEVILC